MPVRRYTQRFKLTAIARLKEVGYPALPGALIQVAHELNVPRSTLQFWFQNPHQPIRRARSIAPIRDAAPPISAPNFRPFPASSWPQPLPISGDAPPISASNFAHFPASSSPQHLPISDAPPITHAPIIDPSQISPRDLLNFYSAELAHISAIIDAYRETASYKDLFATFRLLTADIEALKLRIQREEDDEQSTYQILSDLIMRVSTMSEEEAAAALNDQPESSTPGEKTS